uniref:Uncharacterized protein n=1 Tax=Anopheles atroparvus TaxID=41427 RepID=A0A182IY32_ANOAO
MTPSAAGDVGGSSQQSPPSSSSSSWYPIAATRRKRCRSAVSLAIGIVEAVIDVVVLATPVAISQCRCLRNDLIGLFSPSTANGAASTSSSASLSSLPAVPKQNGSSKKRNPLDGVVGGGNQRHSHSH